MYINISYVISEFTVEKEYLSMHNINTLRQLCVYML